MSDAVAIAPDLPTLRPFDRAALGGDPLDAARALVGAYLVRDAGRLSAGGSPAEAAGRHDERDLRVGRIVEVEAYVGTSDAASHARFGRTKRNEVMWGEPGRAYVYLVYGMYDCLNVVVGPRDSPAAVLVRAVEPIVGLDAMRAGRLAHADARRRAWTPAHLRAEASRLAAIDPRRIAAGPGAVTAAFSIDRTDTGADLCASDGRLRLACDEQARDAPVVATPRIGIDYAAEPWRSIAWRFVDAASASLSGPGRRRPDPRA